MMDPRRCVYCDRPNCPWLEYEPMDCDEYDAQPEWDTYWAKQSCSDHRVDWRERALRAEAELAAVRQRASTE